MALRSLMHRRALPWLAAQPALAILLYSCGSKPPSPTSVAVQPLSTATAPSAQPAQPSPVSNPAPVATDPLCGRPITDTSLLNRHPLAVKIDNITEARPQSGLAEACTVYEHLTEWDITRFTAIYYVENPETLGPIRSARLVDISLAAEYDGLLAHAGGSEPVRARIKASGLKDLDQFNLSPSDTTYYRIKSRPSPFNLYTSTALLRSLAGRRGWGEAKPQPARTFLTPNERRVGSPADVVKIPFSKENTVEYRYDKDKGAYGRYVSGAPHNDAITGQQIFATNVIVQYVKIIETDIVEDANGSRSRDMQLVGEGKAQVFHDGQLYEARWSRPSPDKLTQFLGEDGKPLPLRPGNIWIALVPLDMQGQILPTAQ
ncbi:MAG: DUF3048 domain-containing protein [Chloroflexi bacterium]|nr:DUF3048 domain-containing protein [Chloroflexota bacterium]